MSIAGEHPTLGPITILESPSAPSLGKYSVTDFGDGTDLQAFLQTEAIKQVRAEKATLLSSELSGYPIQ